MTTPPTETPCDVETVEACIIAAKNFTPIMYGSSYNKGFTAAQQAIIKRLSALPTRKPDEGALVEALEKLDMNERNRLGAALSLRSWHGVEVAFNNMRDGLHRILAPSRRAKMKAIIEESERKDNALTAHDNGDE